MKKRFFLPLLVLCISFLAIGTVKASAATYGDLTYEVSNGEVTITDCDTSVTRVEIPAEIDGYPVTRIGSSAFRDCTSLTYITLPERVTSIGDSAFEECASLTSITVPNGVTSIEAFAFLRCSGLTSITLPDSLTSIKCSSFNGCSSLTSITIPEGVSSIGSSAFFNCTRLTSITMPDALTSIENSAFYDCASLTSITLPASLTSVGNCAFKGCTSLESVYISDLAAYLNCTYEGWASNPMYCAKQLYLNGTLVKEEIAIPESVTQIPDYALCGQAITSVIIPESVTSIECRTFWHCDSLADITIPEGVTFIGEGAFSDCTSLTGITIPEGVTSIEDGTFTDCTNLTSVTLPDGLTSIGMFAFSCCHSLTSITIPDCVTSIEHSAFEDCSNLTSITFPEGVTSIKYNAFAGCTRLSSVTIPANIISIEGNAFYRCNALETVYYDGTDDDWDLIYIADGNDPLLNARRQNCVRVTLIDEAGKTQTLICELGQPISISQVEAIYKHRVTLYTDASLTQPFDLSTPITDRITLYVQLGDELASATLRGQVCSYNPAYETVIRLLQNGAEKYTVTIPAKKKDSGQITQMFSIPDVAEGSYDLVVSKVGHLPFTIRGVIMGTEDLDLTANSNEAISTITLLAGDLNGDGSINTKDRTVLNRNLNLAGSDIGNALADITGDGLVNSKDRTILTKNLNKSEENDCIIDYQEGSHET